MKAAANAVDHLLFNRILLATDFSPASKAALPYAAAIARHFAATLYLAHVIPPEAYTSIPVAERDSALRKIRAHVGEKMAGLRAETILAGVVHEGLVDHGDIWPILSAMAEKHNINLIVIGTQGRWGFEKLLLGSTAEEILRHSQIPLLMVGPETSVAPEVEAKPRRILYATDFSPVSEPAMRCACYLAREYGAELFFLHVAEDIWKEPLATRMQAADFFRMRLLEESWVLAEGAKPEFRVEFGPRAGRILENAAKLNIELVVLGVRGTEHPRLAAHLPGPTAYDVVSHAPCPVLVVRGTAGSLGPPT